MLKEHNRQSTVILSLVERKRENVIWKQCDDKNWWQFLCFFFYFYFPKSNISIFKFWSPVYPREKSSIYFGLSAASYWFYCYLRCAVKRNKDTLKRLLQTYIEKQSHARKCDISYKCWWGFTTYYLMETNNQTWIYFVAYIVKYRCNTDKILYHHLKDTHTACKQHVKSSNQPLKTKTKICNWRENTPRKME